MGNSFEKENLSKTKIYLLKQCSSDCIKDYNSFNLLKNESDCMKTCFNEYFKFFYDEN